jgi:hypothetical protein
MHQQYAHRPYDGTKRHWTMMLEGDTPLFAGLMEDPRFLNPTKQMYGEDVLGVCVDANRYVGHTGWHRDTATIHQYGIKWAFYLEPVDAETGALRVVPGSHAFPDDAPFNKYMSTFEVDQVPAQALVSQPGDVVGFDLRCWHASLGGSNDRRMCTVVYYGNPKNNAEEQALVNQAKNNAKISWQQFGCKREYLYSQDWLSNKPQNPDRQHWIDRLTKLGYFAAPGLVESK